MADLDASDGIAQNSSNENGVLANLPRTRPQRSTPRRAAARSSGSPDGAGSARSSAAASPRKRARAQPPRERAQPPRERVRKVARPAPAAVSKSKLAPVQGYESDSEAARGSVQPPGAIELLASAAELVGELTKSGFSRSERLLKDIASRLPLS